METPLSPRVPACLQCTLRLPPTSGWPGAKAGGWHHSRSITQSGNPDGSTTASVVRVAADWSAVVRRAARQPAPRRHSWTLHACSLAPYTRIWCWLIRGASAGALIHPQPRLTASSALPASAVSGPPHHAPPASVRPAVRSARALCCTSKRKPSPATVSPHIPRTAASLLSRVTVTVTAPAGPGARERDGMGNGQPRPRRRLSATRVRTADESAEPANPTVHASVGNAFSGTSAPASRHHRPACAAPHPASRTVRRMRRLPDPWHQVALPQMPRRGPLQWLQRSRQEALPPARPARARRRDA